MITKIAKKFEETSFYEVSSYGKIPLTLAASIALSLGVSNIANAATISPISYDMINGGSGSFNYWDKNYTGSGDTTQDYAVLSGGLGDLTDGVIATDNWFNVENSAGEGPYVGWLFRNPTITFNFDSVVNIDSITIYVDDSNGSGDVRVPASVDLSMGGASFSSGTLFDPPGSAPTSYTFSNLGFTGSSVDLTLNRRDNWIFVSEVTFEEITFPESSTPVPEPSKPLIILGVGTVLGVSRFFKQKLAKKANK